MARKKKHEEHENHERWLISYADFITLLFAFFVVMYSVSSVNEGKYRVLSDALVAAFRAPAKSMQPVQVGQAAKSPAGVEFSIRKSPAVIKSFDRPLPAPNSKDGQKEKQAELKRNSGKAQDAAKAQSQTQTPSEAAAAIQKMADEIEHAMQNLIKEDLISVRRSTFWLEVEINTSILYSSGNARLAPDAVPVLEELAKILTPFPNAVHVEGFTDDVPINTLTFPSNWELSAARAASVVTLFAKTGIDPARLAAIGYGEYRPVADNDTEEGRAKNRRVVVVVMSGVDKRDASKAAPPQQLEKQLHAPMKPVTESHIATPPVATPAVRVVPAPAHAASAAHASGEPIDVTSREQTEVGRFPVVNLPIAVPLPADINIKRAIAPALPSPTPAAK